MNIYEGIKGKQYKITSLLSDDVELKDRLHSFGINEDNILTVSEFSPKKLTISVMVNNSQVALRDSEARVVQVTEL